MATAESLPQSGIGEKQLIKVESKSRPGRIHYVSADLEHCSCEATVLCRHIRIARIRAKRRQMVACMGCGVRRERRDLIELQEGQHDNLTYFHGDLLCEGCCDDAGVVP